MTEQKPNYDGNSEACRGCKAFYRTGNDSAPCDTCSYRIDEDVRENAIRNATLDELIYWLYDVPFRGQDDAGKCHRTLAAKLESLRTKEQQ